MKRLSLLLLLACSSGQMMMTGSAPKIVSTTPAAMAADVSVTTSLAVEFSLAMDPSTVMVTFSPQVELTASWNDAHTVATFTHDTAFEYATEYTVRVAGSDTMAQKLTGNSAFAFSTQAAPEMTPPTLVSSTPGSGATAVPTASTLQLVFSEKMDVASLQLTPAPAFDWGTATWSVGDTTATFSMPPMPLAGATPYTLVINAADLAGNPLAPVTLTFTTAAGTDTTPPEVIGTAPSASATGVSTNVQPSVTFSEAMSAGSNLALTVSPDAGCVPTLDGSGTLLTCVHAGLLAASTQYTLTVSTAAKDLANNTLAAPFTFSFTTGSTTDTTAPMLSGLTPAMGATGAPRFPSLVASFSEPMDKATTQGALSTTPARQLFFAWNDGGTQVRVIADGGFSYGAAVTFAASTAAKDLAGNALAAAGSTSFTVRHLCTGAKFRSNSTDDGFAIGTKSGVTLNTGTRVRVGRSSKLGQGTELYRGLLMFPIGGTATGCQTNAVSKDALAITSAQLTTTQVAATGTPYGTALSAGKVEVDWIPIEPGSRYDAGIVFDTKTPCRTRNCVTPLAPATNTSGPRSADVTEALNAALDARRTGLDTFTLRLTNDYAEQLGGTRDDYCDFADGTSTTGATLDVSYEYP
ncbi:MAG: Ig-like domain-containing protein [Archangiaceae bacterium]|nr:Ig-like domain-containing protein [Archangiaceae bacterium]